jgi:hypothetical protein
MASCSSAPVPRSSRASTRSSSRPPAAELLGRGPAPLDELPDGLARGPLGVVGEFDQLRVEAKAGGFHRRRDIGRHLDDGLQELRFDLLQGSLQGSSTGSRSRP